MGAAASEGAEPLARGDIVRELEEWRAMSDEEREAIPLTPEQERELDRRLDALDRGDARVIPADEVHALLERLL